MVWTASHLHNRERLHTLHLCCASVARLGLRHHVSVSSDIGFDGLPSTCALHLQARRTLQFDHFAALHRDTPPDDAQCLLLLDDDDELLAPPVITSAADLPFVGLQWFTHTAADEHFSQWPNPDTAIARHDLSGTTCTREQMAAFLARVPDRTPLSDVQFTAGCRVYAGGPPFVFRRDWNPFASPVLGPCWYK